MLRISQHPQESAPLDRAPPPAYHTAMEGSRYGFRLANSDNQHGKDYTQIPTAGSVPLKSHGTVTPASRGGSVAPSRGVSIAPSSHGVSIAPNSRGGSVAPVSRSVPPSRGGSTTPSSRAVSGLSSCSRSVPAFHGAPTNAALSLLMVH